MIFNPTEPTHLQTTENGERVVHVWDEDQKWAVETALAAGRPLLIRGEPGIGKTQLATAAAQELTRPLVSFTVDSTTEARDLLWTFDAVQRLAEAQVAEKLYDGKAETLREHLHVKNFVEPGPVWWAINWEKAAKQATTLQRPLPEAPTGWEATKDGIVILIDEIDKADTDVPNGLLEAFGMQQFRPQGWAEPITSTRGVSSPLIVVTTNNERALPDPFLRRCIVLELSLPHCPTEEELKEKPDAADEFLNYLITRAEARFGRKIPLTQLQEAASMLLEDRQAAIAADLHPRPGQAEYFDFLRAMQVLAQERLNKDSSLNKKGVYKEISERIQKFIFQKAAGEIS